MTVTNGYPAAPMSSTVPAPTAVASQQDEFNLMHIENQDVEVIQISKGRTPAMSTFKAIGRGFTGGEFGDVSNSTTEELFVDFPEHKWKEQDMFKREYATNANFAADLAVTTLTFASTSGIIAGHILRVVRTQEQVRVQSVTNGTDIVVKRDISGTSLGTIVTTDTIAILSTSTVGGQTTVSTIGRGYTDKSNYYQKFITTITLNDEEQYRLKLGGKSAIANIVQDRTMVHALELEAALLLGEKATGVDANGNTFRNMEGLVQYAQRGHTDNISNNLTRETLEAALAKPLQYTKNGNMKKIAFCGSRVRPKISALFEGRLQVGQIQSVDLRFNSIQTNLGEYMLIDHPMLDENSGYSGSMVILDSDYIKLCYPKTPTAGLPGSESAAGFDGKTRYVMNSTATDWANSSSSIVTVMSLEASNANSAGVITIV